MRTLYVSKQGCYITLKAENIIIKQGESVFECILYQNKYKELQKRLRQQVNLSEDSVRFYPLSKHTFNQIETWGEPPVTELPGSTVI